MGPDLLMERLQRAVSPDYRVEHELGSGGMGRVYLAHEVLLNRSVAIKVLRPELATAQGAAAFLREAQILAGIQHPNVVVIYKVGEAEGLQYYVMEFVKGPTLEQRFEAGPMRARDVAQVGIDVLHGLETIHRLGVVHRDIKPGNIFVLPGRAVLADFGIAQPPSDDEDVHTRYGTPDYMSNEQVQGKPVTPRSDIYSLGVVLYEAVAGRRYHEQGDKVDWHGVPFRLARVLRRALEKAPEDRWADAAAFRKALQRISAPFIPSPPVIVGGAIVLSAVTIAIIRPWPSATPPSPSLPNQDRPQVSFASIDYVGPSERRPVADSLLRMVHSDLVDHITFGDASAQSLIVRARMTVTGGDVSLHLTGGIPASDFHVPYEHRFDLRDSVSYQIVLGVWRDRSPLASLPLHALPRTTEGLVRFLEAEQLITAAKWDTAHAAYLRAEASDPSCWICSWRITETERWLGNTPDPERVRRYRTHADSLQPPYRSLILAGQLPLRERWDTLRVAAEGSADVFLGWFQLGDELFHRGPLIGHRRAEAMLPLERAARLRPDFQPAWEHLAWVATAEGDSAEAADALDSLDRHSVSADRFSLKLRALLAVGFAWRFLPDSTAARITAQAAQAPGVREDADLGAGPRYLPTFDVPRGAVALGQILEASATDKRSGLIAQTLGALALGRLADMREAAQRLTVVSPEAEIDLFTAELRAALALLDPGSISVADALAGLQPWIASTDTRLHNRAAWMSALLDHRTARGPGTPLALELLVSADSLAAEGHPRAALVLLDQIDLDAAARRFDPFFRTIAHMRRADWRFQIGDSEGARAELRWHEHNDVVGLPTGLPQAAEVDWAFGTLARWRLARRLDVGRRPARGEACDAYAGVIRHWSNAPPPYGARAETARTRARALKCATVSKR